MAAGALWELPANHCRPADHATRCCKPSCTAANSQSPVHMSKTLPWKQTLLGWHVPEHLHAAFRWQSADSGLICYGGKRSMSSAWVGKSVVEEGEDEKWAVRAGRSKGNRAVRQQRKQGGAAAGGELPSRRQA